MSQYRCLCLLAFFLLLSGGCATRVVLNGDVDGAIVGDPPPHELKVGSFIVEAGGGDVTVVAAPAGALGQKWVQINHPLAQTPPTALRAEPIRMGPGR